MPKHVDILIERLRGFDEVTLLELLDLTSDDLVNRFKDIIIAKREYLFGEVEILDVDEDEEYEDELDGFQIEYIPDDLEDFDDA